MRIFALAAALCRVSHRCPKGARRNGEKRASLLLAGISMALDVTSQTALAEENVRELR